MYTPKIILYKHKTYKNGLHPICIQIVKNGQAVRKVIGQCSEKDWNKSKSRVSPRNIEAPRLNNEIEKALRNFGMSKAYTLVSLFKERIENFKLKQQVARYNINNLVLEQLLEFAPDVEFEDVTETFINKFVAHLNNSPGTIKEKMNVLGGVLKQAKKLKLIHDDPFEEIKFPRGKSVKSKLSVDEIKMLMDAELKGKVDEARDIFIASIYLRGARIGDMLTLKKENIIDGRLHYEEIKTGKQHNVLVSEDLHRIFDKWIGKNHYGYIFTFLEAVNGKDKFQYKSGIKNAVAKLSRYLKQAAKDAGITKNVSTHTARHSFSKLANSVIQNTSITKDLIGHATLAVHEGYISDISDDVIMDGYAKQVLDQLK